MLDDLRRGLLGSHFGGVDIDVGDDGRLIGAGDAGEVRKLSGACLPVQSLDVVPLRFRQRRVDKELDELARPHHVAPLCAERCNEGRNHDDAGIGHQARHFTNAANVLHAIGVREARDRG